MSQTFEDQETRRLDLAEREIAIREKALEAEIQRLQRESDDRIADRAERRTQRETEHDDWQIHRSIVEEGNRMHGELLNRIAIALEKMAEVGATIR